MLFAKYHSLVEGMTIEDPKSDEKAGRKIGQYKIGRLAVYRPDGGYIPKNAIRQITADKGSVHVSGCCVGNLPVDRVVVKTANCVFQFVFNSVKQAAEAAELIRMNAE